MPSHSVVAGRGSVEWGVRCASCASASSEVHDTRPTLAGTIRRRRWCKVCGHRYTTQEVEGARLDRLMELEKLDSRLRGLGDREYEIVKAVLGVLSSKS